MKMIRFSQAIDLSLEMLAILIERKDIFWRILGIIECSSLPVGVWRIGRVFLLIQAQYSWTLCRVEQAVDSWSEVL